MDALLTTRRQLLVGGVTALALGGCSRRGAPAALHLSGTAMASTYNVKLVRGPGLDAERVHAAVHSALTDVDARMSMYRADSELSQLNRQPAQRPLVLSAELFALLETAQQVAALSDGAFDVTVAPLVETWGFGVEKRQAVPDAARVQREQRAVGWRDLRIDAATRTATKARDGMRLDLGGIAKGHGVDRAAAALDALGVADYMVEHGGEVRTRGRNAAGQPWRIGIEQPDALPQRARWAVPLSGLSMATSGDYRNYFVDNGQRYSHAIDPAQGRPIRHALCSVTVVAEDCTRADALATALIVLGAEKGRALAMDAGIAAQFIERTADGDYRDTMTPAFAALGATRA